MLSFSRFGLSRQISALQARRPDLGCSVLLSTDFEEGLWIEDEVSRFLFAPLGVPEWSLNGVPCREAEISGEALLN